VETRPDFILFAGYAWDQTRASRWQCHCACRRARFPDFAIARFRVAAEMAFAREMQIDACSSSIFSYHMTTYCSASNRALHNLLFVPYNSCPKSLTPEHSPGRHYSFALLAFRIDWRGDFVISPLSGESKQGLSMPGMPGMPATLGGMLA
jgi:hypothetical protein